MLEQKILIGTLVKGEKNAAEYIRKILPYGFETFSITFWESVEEIDLERLAGEVNKVLDGTGVSISSLGIYANPLLNDEKGEIARTGWKKLLNAAKLFGCDMICGFTGRIVDKPINESIHRFAEVFDPMARHARDLGLRIAFENCNMGGDWYRGNWNIAHGPLAWEMMFDSIYSDNVGLEWEPCHQLVKLIDPIPQLRNWVSKIFHVHGKDASVYWDVIREFGIHGPKKYVVHRTPGFGESNWNNIISELRAGGFRGSIDIEGWHDPVYKNELEMTGQVYALNYLKACRGGDLIANP